MLWGVRLEDCDSTNVETISYVVDHLLTKNLLHCEIYQYNDLKSI